MVPFNFAPTLAAKENASLTAIVDIGSNTVRLVVFHGPARVPLPLFNEKVQCGLGRGLDQTGCLNPEGLALAHETLNRFMKLIEVMGVHNVSLLATAAVREAKDGPDFVEKIKTRFGAEVRVLSGEEESKLAAMGLLSGLPYADGLLGDMGGSSFDLVLLNNGKFGRHDTTPLGHLRLTEHAGSDPDALAKQVRKSLSNLDWVDQAANRPFYAVGGALRAVAKIILHLSQYPVHIVDNFTLSREETLRYLEQIGQLSEDEINLTPDVSKKRLETIPAALALLKEIFTTIQPSCLVFSGYSMREGQFFLSLPPELRKQDPLVSACTDIVEREGRFGAQGEEVFNWMSPLFPDETPQQARMRHAACLLHDIAWCEHPDYRAEHAMLRLLRLPVAGLTHHDRALLAAPVYSRYKGDFKSNAAAPLQFLLEEADAIWTKTVGAALRLAHTLAGGAPHLLDHTRLEMRGGELILGLPENQTIFTGDAVEKRLATVAKFLNLSPRIEHG